MLTRHKAQTQMQTTHANNTYYCLQLRNCLGLVILKFLGGRCLFFVLQYRRYEIGMTMTGYLI